MRLIYHPEAEAELVDAAEYYEEQLPGLGRSFSMPSMLRLMLSCQTLFVPQCVAKESGVIC
jgi:hypothetical protein